MIDEGVIISMGHPHRASSAAQIQHSPVPREGGSLLQATEQGCLGIGASQPQGSSGSEPQ